MMAQEGSTAWGGTRPKESVDESAKWSGKETEESASGEEAETARGEEEAVMTLTATAEESEGSGAEDGPGGAAASGGTSSDATSKEADAAGVGVWHRSNQRKGRVLPPGRKPVWQVLWSGRQRGGG